jgi:predicted DNA-binding transcriptional regulator AlpA
VADVAETESENRLPASQVWNRYGVTDRTLDRWLKDEKLKFPRPIIIRNRRYWTKSGLVAWELARAVGGKAA